MRESIPVMVFPGKGGQMENTGRIESAGVRQEASTGLTEETRWESSDIKCDVSTVLRSRRWEQREGPFQGFGSPEGEGKF
jgi:hypothetical protein